MNLFSNIGSMTNLQDAKKLLADIEKAAEQEVGLEDQGDNLVLLRKSLREAEDDFKATNAYLQKILEENVRQNMSRMKDTLASEAKDYRSAYDMTTFYTREWFSRLFMTLDAKIELADYLTTLVTPFNVQNTGTWDLIVQNDPGMLGYIAVPHNDT